MYQVTPRSGVFVVLKTIVDSDERQLLQHLKLAVSRRHPTTPSHYLKSSTSVSAKRSSCCPGIVPLMRFRNLVTILTTLCPFAFNELKTNFVFNSWPLHQHKVAHCDLKPGNVVVDTLWVGDVAAVVLYRLDRAQSVESEETMTEGWCGTPHGSLPILDLEMGRPSGTVQS